jgi:hypothetical protein
MRLFSLDHTLDVYSLNFFYIKKKKKKKAPTTL